MIPLSSIATCVTLRLNRGSAPKARVCCRSWRGTRARPEKRQERRGERRGHKAAHVAACVARTTLHDFCSSRRHDCSSPPGCIRSSPLPSASWQRLLLTGLLPLRLPALHGCTSSYISTLSLPHAAPAAAMASHLLQRGLERGAALLHRLRKHLRGESVFGAQAQRLRQNNGSGSFEWDCCRVGG